MINKTAFELTEKHLREHLGTGIDLPRELLNTFANTCYRYYCYLLSNKININSTPQEIRDALIQLPGITDPSQAAIASQVVTDYESVPEFILALRDIDRLRTPDKYQYWVDYILDSLKYNISNPQNKPGFVRVLERQMKKKDVHEIPNLVELMNLD